MLTIKQKSNTKINTQRRIEKQTKQEKEIIQQDRDISQRVFSEAVKLMTQKNISVEEAQKQAITMIAAQQIQIQKQGDSD